MTNADMIEAMARAIGPGFIGNRMPDMSGDPLRKATPYERRRIDEAVTAALAVVQPELDRLRAENEALRREAATDRRFVHDYAYSDSRTRDEISDRFCLVPPDGGDVKTWSAAKAMRNALESSEALVAELRAENARLREALEPFAKRAERYDPDEADDGEPDWSTASPSIRIGDLRRARSELEAGHE